MRITLFFILQVLTISLFGQYKKADHPKLIVAVTVDQMRYDYISRFWEKYDDDGFKRIISKGFFFENGHYNYGPTYTAPGHASIFTGTTPSMHGIIGNNWYDKYGKANLYCTQDTTVHTVGGEGNAGKMSPANMLSSTFADQLKLSTNFRSKAIGISLKDRGAILPAGHAADGAFWFDGSTGKWITSSFYMNSLPSWVDNFNKEGHTSQWINQGWNTLLPIHQYHESIADNNPFEKPFTRDSKAVFPYDLTTLSQTAGIGIIRSTPFGNTMTKDLAKRAIKAENLGKDQFTDFLSISFSSTDYVGHVFGPRSIELEDTYLRLDKDLGDLIKHLDREVGKNNYVLFLTADHGAVETPLFLENKNIPAGYFRTEPFKSGLNEFLNQSYGDGSWVENVSNDQIFLNHDLITSKAIDKDKMVQKIAKYCIDFDGISFAIGTTDLIMGNFTQHNLEKLQKGIHQKRSGDIVVLLEPNWIAYMRQGTTHGSTYTYDTHVPILFYGKNIRHGNSFIPMDIIDIIPSITAMMHIQTPNSSTGKIHTEMFKKKP